jgi:hypothetical protein
MVLLQTMMLKTIDDIKDEFEWPELTREYAFKLVSGVDSYPLPGDYNFKLNQTLWNRTAKWPLIGPLNGQEWQTYKSGIVATFPRQRFRVKGIGYNKFFIDPPPDSSSEGQVCIFEYISRSAIVPVQWTPNTAGGNQVSNNGLILYSAAGTTANNGQAPTYGVDNTVLWDSVPDYVASMIYYVGQYVYANSKVYKVTTSGLSTATIPSVTSGSETIGTAVFQFQSNASPWVGGTAYNIGNFTSANSHAYICTSSGISGRLSPKFYDVLPGGSGGSAQSAYPPNILYRYIIDGTVTWYIIEAPFEIFTADTNQVVLDNGFIVDGTVWRYKAELGLDYEDLRKQAEDQKELAKTKLIGASSVNVGNRYGIPFGIGPWSIPEANYGSS